jgi:glucosyl-dolichyl phosphate glucuronosyltransferase
MDPSAMTSNSSINVPFVSVVIPTFNRSGYIMNAIRSVTHQDYPVDRYEIIVVDNASTDDTHLKIQQLVGELDHKYNFKYVIENRKGLSFARNTGAAHAVGSIFLFTDDDATFDANWISAIANVYIEHPEAGAVGSKILIQWDHEPEPWVRQYEGLLGRLDWTKKVVVEHGMELFGGSLSVRRDVFFRVNGFNPGQVGEYLVGDCDTGICRKFSNEGILVGYTPLTTMWHLQTVEKNANLKDLKRRFANCGISDAYGATFYNWETTRVVKDFLGKTRGILSGFLIAMKKRDAGNLHRYMVLDMTHYLYYLEYLILYRFNRKMRRLINKKDWEFGSNYKIPPIEYQTSVK